MEQHRTFLCPVQLKSTGPEIRHGASRGLYRLCCSHPTAPNVDMIRRLKPPENCCCIEPHILSGYIISTTPKSNRLCLKLVYPSVLSPPFSRFQNDHLADVQCNNIFRRTHISYCWLVVFHQYLIHVACVSLRLVDLHIRQPKSPQSNMACRTTSPF